MRGIIMVLEVIMMMVSFSTIIVVVGYVCVIVFGLIVTAIADNRFAQQMRAAGRYLAWKDVAVELESGRGTLIIDWIFPNGRLREWWTPDDVINFAPTSISKWVSEELPEQGGSLREYAHLCVLKYIDPVYGTAKLTKLPWRGIESILKRCRVVTLMGYPDNREVALVLGHVLRER